MLLGLLAGWPSAAGAYRTSADTPELAGYPAATWPDGTVSYVLHAGGAPGLGLAETESAVTRAFQTWAAVDCAALVVNYAGVTEADAVLGDGRNTVQWISSGWAGSASGWLSVRAAS